MQLKTKRACIHCGRKFGLRGVKTHERTCINTEAKLSIERGLKQSAKGDTVYKGSFAQYAEDELTEVDELPSEVEQLAGELKAAHQAYESAEARMRAYINRLRGGFPV